MQWLLASLFILGAVAPVRAQTGPGGVGNGSGASGQPENVLWLRGDLGVEDANNNAASNGGRVQHWRDQSGNGNDVETIDPGNGNAATSNTDRPFYRTANGGGVDFVSSGDQYYMLGNNVISGTTGRTFFTVIEPSAVAGGGSNNCAWGLAPNTASTAEGYGLFVEEPTDDGIGLRVSGNKLWDYSTEVNQSQLTSNPTLVAGGSPDNGVVNDSRLFINGDELTTVATSKNLTATLDTDNSGTLLGGYDVDGNFTNGVSSTGAQYAFNGDIYEMIVFATELNAAQRAIVSTYLAEKYPLVTSGSDIQSFNYTTQFFDDFAGLGRTSSTDEHTDAQSDVLRIQAPTALDNDDFLFFGHDNANATAWTNTETPSSDYRRLAREWRLDESNGDGQVGTLTIQVDASELPALPSGNSDNYFVAVDGDGDFTTLADQTRTALTLSSGTVYNASGIATDDGDYVTLLLGGAPATPSNVTATPELNQRTLLSWDAVTTNAFGNATTLTGDTYRIYQNTSDDFSTATQVATSTTTNDVEITGLANGTTYYFWITAVNAIGESEPQASGIAVTPELLVRFAQSSSAGSEATNGQIELELSDDDHGGVTVTVSSDPPSDFRSVSSLNITNGGSGYAVNDVITATNGGGSGFSATVTGVDGSGAITGFDITSGGTGYTTAPTSFSVTGSGSGAAFSAGIQSANDFTQLSNQSVSFAANDASATVTLTVSNDNLVEQAESVELEITGVNSGPATLGAPTTHDYIINDDDNPRLVDFSNASSTVSEGTATANITVEVNTSDPVNNTVIDYNILATSTAAGGGVDYTDVGSGQVTISSGNTTADITLNINDDNLSEADETIVLDITSTTNSSIDFSGTTSHTVTIQDNDNAPEVAFTNAGSSGSETSAPSIEVSVSPTSSASITVDLSASAGSPAATGGGTDYDLLASSVTIPAGQSSVTLQGSTLSIIDDILDEADEVVQLAITNPTSSGPTPTLGSQTTHDYTINDDDPQPTLTFDNAGATVAEGNTTFTVSLSLSVASGQDVQLSYSVSGTASGGGADFTDQTGSPLSISAGNTAATISLDIEDDFAVENDETVILSFSSSSLTNASTGAISSFTLTIEDDDFGRVGPGGVGTQFTNVLWLRADAGVEDASGNAPGNGDRVQVWRDQSGNNADVSAPSAGERPFFRSSQGGSVDFENGSYYLTGSSVITGGVGRTFFSVLQPSSLSSAGSNNCAWGLAPNNGNDGEGYGLFVEEASSNRGLGLRVNGNKLMDYTTDGFSNADLINNPFIIGGSSTANSPVTATEFYLNGVTLTDVATQSNNPPSLNTNAAGIALGGYDSDGSFSNGFNSSFDFNGDIYELIVFDEDLNTVRREIIQNYLSAKYSISISSGIDRYAGDNSGNGDYDSDVIGIGRASASDLHEAAEGGNLILERNSGLDNGDYLFAGHNGLEGGNTVDITTNGTSTLQARTRRIWYFDVTDAGTNLTVDITFTLPGEDLSSAVASDYVLLYRSGQTGNWEEAVVGATRISSVVFEDVNIADPSGSGSFGGDGYWSLGTLDNSNSPLPVELTDFTAQWSGEDAMLEWQTASELNNSHFEVQRSRDGDQWKVLDEVEGHGTTTQAQRYGYVDALAREAATEGRLFYRLEQFDFDGTSAYSPVVLLRSGRTEEEERDWYAHLEAEGGRLQVGDLPEDAQEVRLWSSSGRPLDRWRVEGQGSGVRRLPLRRPVAAGLYMVEVQGATGSSWRKVIRR